MMEPERPNIIINANEQITPISIDKLHLLSGNSETHNHVSFVFFEKGTKSKKKKNGVPKNENTFEFAVQVKKGENMPSKCKVGK